MMLTLSAFGQDINSLVADTAADKAVDLKNVIITSRRAGTRRAKGPANATIIGREELFKAACCNLGPKSLICLAPVAASL